jgi:hypothetical protein
VRVDSSFSDPEYLFCGSSEQERHSLSTPVSRHIVWKMVVATMPTEKEYTGKNTTNNITSSISRISSGLLTTIDKMKILI